MFNFLIFHNLFCGAFIKGAEEFFTTFRAETSFTFQVLQLAKTYLGLSFKSISIKPVKYLNSIIF